MSGLLAEIDTLYEGCAMDPTRWNDRAFEDWAESVASSYEVDREMAKLLRRAINAARRIARFWAEPDRPDPPADWRSRVDIALGPRAWRPQLEVAQAQLERSGDPETFARVSELFPVVTNQPYLDGITYDEWVQDRASR